MMKWLNKQQGNVGLMGLAWMVIATGGAVVANHYLQVFQSSKNESNQKILRQKGDDENISALAIVSGLVRGSRPILYLDDYLAVTEVQANGKFNMNAAKLVSSVSGDSGNWKLDPSDQKQQTILIDLPQAMTNNEWIEAIETGRPKSAKSISARVKLVDIEVATDTNPSFSLDKLITAMIFESTVTMVDPETRRLTKRKLRAKVNVEPPPPPRGKLTNTRIGESKYRLELKLTGGIAAQVEFRYYPSATAKKPHETVLLNYKKIRGSDGKINAYSHNKQLFWTTTKDSGGGYTTITLGNKKLGDLLNSKTVGSGNGITIKPPSSGCNYTATSMQTLENTYATSTSRTGQYSGAWFEVILYGVDGLADPVTYSKVDAGGVEDLDPIIGETIKTSTQMAKLEPKGAAYNDAVKCITKGNFGRFKGKYGNCLWDPSPGEEDNKVTNYVLPVCTQCTNCSSGMITPSSRMYILTAEAGGGCKKIDIGNRSGSCGCFAEDTLILLADGTEKSISALEGYEIIWNPILQKGQRISKLIRGPEEKPMYRIKAANVSLDVTETHPFPTPFGIKKASELEIYDQIMIANNSFVSIVAIEEVEVANKPVVWNLSLEGGDSDSEHMVVANGVVTGDLYLQLKNHSQ